MNTKTEIPEIEMPLNSLEYKHTSEALLVKDDTTISDHYEFYRDNGDQLIVKDSSQRVDIFYVKTDKGVAIMKIKQPYLGKDGAAHFKGEERAMESAKNRLVEIIQKSV